MLEVVLPCASVGGSAVGIIPGYPENVVPDGLRIGPVALLSQTVDSKDSVSYGLFVVSLSPHATSNDAANASISTNIRNMGDCGMVVVPGCGLLVVAPGCGL